MYQKCPNCNGSGVDPTTREFDRISTCPVCKGTRIINSETGLPPDRENLSKANTPKTDIQKVEGMDIGV